MRLYVNSSVVERNDFKDDLEALVLSPHPNDPCDAVVFGHQHPRGHVPQDEIDLFEALARRWNEAERRRDAEETPGSFFVTATEFANLQAALGLEDEPPSRVYEQAPRLIAQLKRQGRS